MAKITILYFLLAYTYAISAEELVRLTLETPGIEKLEQFIANEMVQTRTIITQSADGITISLNKASQTLEKFDPQNIFLCGGGLLLVGGGVTCLCSDSTNKKLIGTSMTLGGLLLIIFSHQILNCVNS